MPPEEKKATSTDDMNLRLACLTQAVASRPTLRSNQDGTRFIVDRAAAFEAFVRTGQVAR